MSRMFTVKAAAGMIQEQSPGRAPSVQTLYRWLNEGRIFKKAQRIGINGWLIPEEELERVIREEFY